ncbi:methyl-accepting chemotaxis protein [Oryzomonas japonica]|uniref:Methyl-accepting chemotaxis protein n=1 Tax=Oryzomonas japonica TaxID=2603858 RepID=A0A7J4ZQ86_9BACT|nr:methyl-accepting chemotaxis protein [Oryzomonas japonica]KAB0665164.1 methyl-accepting chemotaxis protein [Oryzomonas japonica]
MKSWSDLRIGTKLLTGFMFLAVIAAIVNGISSLRLAEIKRMQQELSTQDIKPMKDIVELTEAFQKMRVAIRDTSLAQTPEALAKANAAGKESFKAANEALTAIGASSEKSKAPAEAMKDLITRVETIYGKVGALMAAGKSAEADGLLREPSSAQIVKDCTEQLKALTATKISHGNKNTEAAIAITNSSLILSIVCAVVMVLIAVVFGSLITRSITGPVQALAKQAEKIAAGDLTVKITHDSRDEIGTLAASFAKMTESLHDTLQRVSDTSAQVATASNQLQSASEQIATGAEEVSGQAHTVATASEELSATSGDIAQNCHAAAQGAQQATGAAQTGAAVVAQTVSVMTRIAGRVNSTAQSVSGLGARSDQIGAIIGTIEDIADQTNLLALNAAIEAARAGEQGRGFAVVADEVRALAERTTKATKEIDTMIKAIQTETKEAVSTMEEGVKEVQQGTEEASKSGEAIQEILEQINSVTMQVSQIATAAEEQSATTSEITNNIHQISEVVQQTAQSSQESADAAGQLAKLSDDLRSLVNQFRLA